MTNLLNDLRYAIRQLRKSPGFTLTAVLTLALGIGISAAMFTVVDGVLLRPVPVPHSSQIVALGEANDAGNPGSSSLPNLRDWRARSKSFQDIAWYTEKFFDLKKGDGSAQFSINVQTSANFFSMLQAEPLMGRTSLPNKGAEGNADTVVLSYFVWKNNFHADKNILGKTIDLGSDPYTVIGVMPPRFYIGLNKDSSMVWTVLAHTSEMEQRDNRFLNGIGRLRSGVTIASALAELSGIQSNIAKQHEGQYRNKNKHVAVEDYRDTLVGSVRSPLLALMGAVLIVWLIGCANIAGLMLTRMMARRREIAVRSALGASRGRIVRQFLTESVLLGGCGGLCGLGVAYGCLALLRHSIQGSLNDDCSGHTFQPECYLWDAHRRAGRWLVGCRLRGSGTATYRRRESVMHVERLNRANFLGRIAVMFLFVTATVTLAQQSSLPSSPQPSRPLRLDIPHSGAPWTPYIPSIVPMPDLANSAWLDSLIHDGKLYLSLEDAITLGLENNLDIAIARYNLPIAATDLQRADAGGSTRGINTGVVQNTPGAGVGGIGTVGGGGAGGTTAGTGGAGAGASGLVQNTLGTGTTISSYDPLIQGEVSVDRQTSPVINEQIYGVPSLQTHSTVGNFSYTQAFSTGTRMEFDFSNQRQTVNSPFFNLSPSLSSNYRFQLTQPLLAGFGFLPNKRYIYIAKNNEKISSLAFKAQLIAAVTQIENLYWDLFNAYQEEQVQEHSLQFAQQTYENGEKQFALQAIPEMDVLRDEGEVAKRNQDLTVAKTNLQLQELLMKNAITKNLDDSFLVTMPVIPTTQMQMDDETAAIQMKELVAEAMKNRPELAESQLDLRNREITRKTARNALLPRVNLIAYIAGSGLGGPLNPNYGTGFATGLSPDTTTLPSNFGGALKDTFNNSSPEYYIGGQISIPIRNRVAKADQYRAELEYRQAQLLQQEQRKQILIEVENAQYAFEQSRARVDSARKARDLAQKTFGIMQQEQKLGAGSNFQTLSAQHNLALAESDLVTAMTAYERARVELDRAVGETLARNHVSVADAKNGQLGRP